MLKYASSFWTVTETLAGWQRSCEGRSTWQGTGIIIIAPSCRLAIGLWSGLAIAIFNVFFKPCYLELLGEIETPYQHNLVTSVIIRDGTILQGTFGSQEIFTGRLAGKCSLNPRFLLAPKWPLFSKTFKYFGVMACIQNSSRMLSVRHLLGL